MSTNTNPRGAWATAHDTPGRQADAVKASGRRALEALVAAVRNAIPAITEAARTITEATTEPYPDRPDTRRARRYGLAAQNSPYGPTHRRHR